jgi:hypothetical protein
MVAMRGAIRTTIAHNVIVVGGPAAVIDGPFAEPIWRDNTIWQTAGRGGSMPPDGYVDTKPAIERSRPLTEAHVLARIRKR